MEDWRLQVRRALLGRDKEGLSYYELEQLYSVGGVQAPYLRSVSIFDTAFLRHVFRWCRCPVCGKVHALHARYPLRYGRVEVGRRFRYYRGGGLCAFTYPYTWRLLRLVGR